MAFADEKIAFIGAGVMGEAMIRGLLRQNTARPQNIIAADPREDRLAELERRYAIQVTPHNLQAAAAADALVLATKPQAMDKVLSELAGQVDEIRLILSIAAGVPLGTIAEGLGNARVVRSMPNTPAQIGQGVAVWTASPAVSGEARAQAETLLSAMGEQIFAEDERFLDMATALSGSGPAYVFLFMEALVDAGVRMGFARPDADKLVSQTVLGSALYAKSAGAHLAELRNQVTSPGGTTAAALHELEKGGLRGTLADGVWAAYRRSQALGGGDK